jgi:hypothetical protein
MDLWIGCSRELVAAPQQAHTKVGEPLIAFSQPTAR